MPVGVQCLLCHRIFCHMRQAGVEYVYCERCYRSEVQCLESKLAKYKEKCSEDDAARMEYELYKKQVDFLAQSSVQADEGCKPSSTDAEEDEKWSTRHVLLWDVLLVPKEGAPVAAHRAILAGRSPVFRAMFYSCSMREAESGRVLMKDMPREALVAFVEFMYTADMDAETMKRHADVLFCAAHKYAVGLLQSLCEKALASSVDAQNALPMLCLAHRYGSKRIRMAVIRVAIQAHCDLPTAFSHYHDFATHYPGLLLDLYHSLLLHQSQKTSASASPSDSSTSTPTSTSRIRKRRRTMTNLTS